MKKEDVLTQVKTLLSMYPDTEVADMVVLLSIDSLHCAQFRLGNIKEQIAMLSGALRSLTRDTAEQHKMRLEAIVRLPSPDLPEEDKL